MIIRIDRLILFLLAFQVVGEAQAQNATIERADWRTHFSECQVTGTIAVLDERRADPVPMVSDWARALKRYSPASTYKIPHTLFALEAGAVRDEFEVFKWDGVTRGFPGHNQDQNLRSAMRVSALWVYEIFAGRIGEAAAQRYLKRADYGNAQAGAGTYWVDGRLDISALEQIVFLKKLYRNELPFQLAHQRLVKDLMIVEAGRNWILRAKTGWEGRFGWWVGWVEWPTGPVFFALNIDTPRRGDDLFKREAIARAVLRTLDALPADDDARTCAP